MLLKLFFWFVPCVVEQGKAQRLCPYEEFISEIPNEFPNAVLDHMFPSMTARREEICGELLLTDVANPPVKVKIRGMVLLLRQLQLHAKSLFQQQALNQPQVLEAAKQADIFKDLFF